VSPEDKTKPVTRLGRMLDAILGSVSPEVRGRKSASSQPYFFNQVMFDFFDVGGTAPRPG
jgi:hypothetical protein